MPGIPSGLPGQQATTYYATPRNIFIGNSQFGQWIPLPIVIDGTNSSNPQNTPFPWLLFAGQILGRETTSKQWRTSIIGNVSATAASSATAVSTDALTATEVNRLLGLNANSLPLTLVGPPTTGGTVATATATAVSVGTGSINFSGTIGIAMSVSSLIMPQDGSQVPLSIIGDQYGVKVIDATNTVRVNQLEAQAYVSGGGVINTGMIQNYPADTSLQAWLKSALRSGGICPSIVFSDDII